MKITQTTDRCLPRGTTVRVEASWDAMDELDIDRDERWTWFDNCIAVTFNRSTRTSEPTVTIQTTRSFEAWQRGEPNAGRITVVIPRRFIESIEIV